MPAGLNAFDRKLLIAAAAFGLLIAVLTVLFAPAPTLEKSKIPSTYSFAPGGARAAFLLLEDLHYPVQRLSEPPRKLLEVNPHAILVLAEPSRSPTLEERHQIRRFVEQGGRVLFAGDSLAAFFPETQLSGTSPPEDRIPYHALVPSPFTRGARTISMRSHIRWEKPQTRSLPLYGGEGGSVVLWELGQGMVLWWAAATPLTNAGLAEEGNLNLFLNAVSPNGAEHRPTIYWDEYFHGAASSLWSYAADTPVRWAALEMLFLAVLVLFSFSRRWGPMIDAPVVSRLSPLEFVETLGGLYRRAAATSLPVAIAYRRLRLHITRRLSLPISTTDEDLSRTVASRLGWNEAELARLLGAANAATSYRPAPRQALKMVRELNAYTIELNRKQTW